MWKNWLLSPIFLKVNSVQESWTKCFAVQIIKFEILQITWKKWIKGHHTLTSQFFTNIFSILMFFVLFFHVVCKISHFNKWTAKHLVQASCTELTLEVSFDGEFGQKNKNSKIHQFFFKSETPLEWRWIFSIKMPKKGSYNISTEINTEDEWLSLLDIKVKIAWFPLTRILLTWFQGTWFFWRVVSQFWANDLNIILFFYYIL